MIWLVVIVIFIIGVIWLLARAGAPTAFDVVREIEIAAPAEKVWAVMMDGTRFAEWHPNVPGYSLSEGGKVGSEVVLHFEEAPGGVLKFVRSHVSAFEEGRKMVWHSRLPFLANFIHHFEVVPVDNQHCRFRQYEEFTGLVWWLIKWLAPEGHPKNLKASVEAGHEAMNEALKKYVEAQ
ncbi:MAG: SRPBCC family protein [Alphaproteobacteria bacterium]